MRNKKTTLSAVLIFTSLLGLPALSQAHPGSNMQQVKQSVQPALQALCLTKTHSSDASNSQLSQYCPAGATTAPTFMDATTSYNEAYVIVDSQQPQAVEFVTR